MIAEDSYGTRKRLLYVAEHLRQRSPSAVLDVGCGTGASLTKPLAMQFPRIQFIGIEPDAATRRVASAGNVLPNLEIVDWPELEEDRRFEVAIVSEVLEHVIDPVAFMAKIRAHVTDDALLLVTLPNGVGPFELASLVQVWAARYLHGGTTSSPAVTGDLAGTNTLAASPHVNFFTWRRLGRVLGAAGLSIQSYRARSFLCGFKIDKIVAKNSGRIAWNCDIADRIPKQWVSGWMLCATPGPRTPFAYRRNAYERVHRRLNELYWRAPIGSG